MPEASKLTRDKTMIANKSNDGALYEVCNRDNVRPQLQVPPQIN